MGRRLIDISADGSDFKVNLEKLVGHRITQVCGYISREFGDPVFKLARICFDSGKAVWVEGEHGMPYLAGEIGNLKAGALEALADDKHAPRGRRVAWIAVRYIELLIANALINRHRARAKRTC